jgi:hypothetical protein
MRLLSTLTVDGLLKHENNRSAGFLLEKVNAWAYWPTGWEPLTVLPQLLSAPHRSSSITWAEDVESVFWPRLVYISTVSITGSVFIFSSSSTQLHPYH